MGSSKKILIILFAGALILSSCAKRKEVKREAEITVPPPETTNVYAPPETTRAETTRGPVIVFEGSGNPPRQMPTTPPEQTSQKPQPSRVQSVIGYRVQIFAGMKKENAQRVASEARRVLSKPVYIEYIPPFYKVRVGDFKNRQDAEEYKEYLRANGYPDAFVVETEIKGS